MIRLSEPLLLNRYKTQPVVNFIPEASNGASISDDAKRRCECGREFEAPAKAQRANLSERAVVNVTASRERAANLKLRRRER